MKIDDPRSAKFGRNVLATTCGSALAATSPLVLASNPVPPSESSVGQAAASTVPLKQVTAAAVADAARRTGRHAAEFTFILAEPVTWSDGSLGCPEEGKGYTDALVRGFRVRVGTSAKDWFEYHAGADGKPFYCPPERIRPPAPDDGI